MARPGECPLATAIFSIGIGSMLHTDAPTALNGMQSYIHMHTPYILVMHDTLHEIIPAHVPNRWTFTTESHAPPLAAS